MKRESLLRLADCLMSQRVDLPEAKFGEHAIEKKRYSAGAKLKLVGLREMLYTGLPQTDYICKEDTVVHSLTGPEGTWMTDLPCECVQQHMELATNARGHVLIGGLGLGIVARMAELKSSVKSISVVEIQSDVIDLVGSHLSDKIRVVQGDALKFLANLPEKYDVALLDTWRDTGEWVWQTEVVPMRRAIGAKIKRVYCWQEVVMLGQVWQGLFRAASLPAGEMRRKQNCHWYAFDKGIRDAGVKVLITKNWQNLIEAEQENKSNPLIEHLARRFCTEVGSSWWERQFGEHWDEAVAAGEES